VLALDTNVLLRVLVDDPGSPEQCVRARKRVKSAGELTVSSIALIELTWVLEDGYKLNRADIARLISHLCDNRAFDLENVELVRRALARYATSNVEFSDVFILEHAISLGATLLSFDKKLAKQVGVELI
jgi:predicted nucleic-acid-binding protein